MAEDKELKAMGIVLGAMEDLDSDEKKRVLGWLSQKLGVSGSTNRPAAHVPHALANAGAAGAFDHSTETIATLIGARSGPDLIIAAAAHLHFVRGQQRFTRQELTTEMRSAPAHFKETFVNNLSTYLTGLTKADRLRLVGAHTYALSSKERQDLEARLANAG
jgi:hypothetical protein